MTKKKDDVAVVAGELAVKTEAALAHPADVPEAWGSENVDAADIIVPKILLMQGLSKLVAADEAKQGEFRDSLTGALLGGKDKPLEFIPFHSTKTWVVFEQAVGGKAEYKETVPMTAHNKDWATEEQSSGGTVRRDRCLNYYVLLLDDIKSGTYMPYMLSFRRTSYTAGRKLATIFAKLKMFKEPPASRVFTLSSRLEKNDLGQFYVADVGEKRRSSSEEMDAALNWYRVVRTASVVVDDSDLKAPNHPIDQIPF